MEFADNKAIWLQICDRVAESVLMDEIGADDRLPSVRDMAVQMKVNPNTVMRAYERLLADGVVVNQRGIGYFVATDAKQRIVERERTLFFDSELPAFMRRMELLNIDIETIVKLYNNENKR